MVRATFMFALLVPLQGCFAGAVEPWFPPEDRLEPPTGALGHWVQDNEKKPLMLDVRAGEGRLLRVAMTSEEHPGESDPFDVAAGKVGASVFLDVQLAPEPLASWREYSVRPHFLLRAAVDGDTLSLWLVDEDWLKGVVRQGRVKVPLSPPWEVEVVEKQPRLITLPTRELKKLVKRLEKEKGKDVYMAPLVFHRVAT